jgi:hypothetical protein
LIGGHAVQEEDLGRHLMVLLKEKKFNSFGISCDFGSNRIPVRSYYCQSLAAKAYFTLDPTKMLLDFGWDSKRVVILARHQELLKLRQSPKHS